MKMKNLSLLFLTLTLVFICVCSQNLAQTQFVYRWPETYCHKDTPPTVRCNQIPPLIFTLVGFWGTNSNGGILMKCPDTAPAGWDKVVFNTAMVDKLSPFWPSLTQQDPKPMWKEAWVTYGTCLTQKFKAPLQYFNRVARLTDEIGNLLKNHLINSDGIVPCDSATYNNVEILNSFKKVANNRDVSFTCKNINTTHAYLNQITFCYNSDAKNFENCPTSVINQRCHIQNIIVPRPSPPARPASLRAPQTNSLWEILGQLI